ncbi:methyltransferase [Aminobacter sp. HY435]|uniref:methyltransferase n=1 Tax=Aminobacter sp. HY435 TaxID=2970917 RepID=UPI0022B98218|nr:methyltransferase [Aminobacter sp. HY435]
MPSTVFEAVDRYLATELSARALALALSRGWIDLLAGQGSISARELGTLGRMPQAATQATLDLLVASGVVEKADGYRLVEEFGQALQVRDLLEAKLWFANLVAPDVHEHFEALLTDVPRFMANAKVFELFRYDRCLDVTPENLAATRRWVAYTTTLTRYEAPEAIGRLDVAGYRSMLDVGGNSGEFARQACARHPRMRATVYDLPVVCELGREHVAQFAEGGRVHFQAGDLRGQPLPRGHDVVSFKSVLHDWPEEYATDFLAKAVDVLEPGGKLVIFERGPIKLDGAPLTYAMVANLVFLPFFREPRFYTEALAGLGMNDIVVEWMELEMPFFLITARKAHR